MGGQAFLVFHQGDKRRHDQAHTRRLVAVPAEQRQMSVGEQDWQLEAEGLAISCARHAESVLPRQHCLDHLGLALPGRERRCKKALYGCGDCAEAGIRLGCVLCPGAGASDE
jgi:hypothetical protein